MPPEAPGRAGRDRAPSADREEHWVEPDSGRRLFFRLWQPPKPRTLLVLAHGFAEHGGRYLPVAQALSTRGLAVAVPDLWGHGRSGGRRGDASSVVQYVEDLRRMTRDVFMPSAQAQRLAVYGHSFGGLLALQWALRDPGAVSRLIVQSPLLALGFPVPAWKHATAEWLARYWPTASIPIGLDPRWLSRNPEVVRAYQRDPYVHRQVSARLYHDMLQAGSWVAERAEALAVPTLVLYGEADRVVSTDAVRGWARRLRSPHETVAIPDAFHELHHEPIADTIIQRIAEWADAA